MHPGSVHYGIESYATTVLSNSIAKFGLEFGRASGGVTTLSNQFCTLFLSDVENSVVFEFAPSCNPERKFSPFIYLRSLVNGGVATHPLNAPDTVLGESRITNELHLIGNLLESGEFDRVLQGDSGWIPKYDSFEIEYDHLANLRTLPPISEHPEKNAIRRKKMEEDLTWMDDVKRILADQESKS